MVFAEIREDEKESFFSLLDEYFAQRPHLLPQPAAAAAAAAPDPASSYGHAAAGFVGRTMAANPQATASFVSNALRSNTPKDSAVSQAAGNPHVSAALGKAVASGLQNFGKPPPPQPPTKPPGVKAPTPSGLVTAKKLGSFDTTSKGAFFASGVQNMVKPRAPAPGHGQQPSFSPPLHSPDPAGPGAGAGASFGARSFAPPPRRPVHAAQPEPEPEPEQEEEQYVEAQEEPQQSEGGGEWVEALYDYQGDAATDVSLAAGDQFVLVERTSEDWWTGEHNGKRGLFPAAYVKVL